jgi:hypothetical protein
MAEEGNAERRETLDLRGQMRREEDEDEEEEEEEEEEDFEEF